MFIIWKNCLVCFFCFWVWLLVLCRFCLLCWLLVRILRWWSCCSWYLCWLVRLRWLSFFGMVVCIVMNLSWWLRFGWRSRVIILILSVCWLYFVMILFCIWSCIMWCLCLVFLRRLCWWFLMWFISRRIICWCCRCRLIFWLCKVLIRRSLWMCIICLVCRVRWISWLSCWRIMWLMVCWWLLFRVSIRWVLFIWIVFWVLFRCLIFLWSRFRIRSFDFCLCVGMIILLKVFIIGVLSGFGFVMVEEYVC